MRPSARTRARARRSWPRSTSSSCACPTTRRARPWRSPTSWATPPRASSMPRPRTGWRPAGSTALPSSTSDQAGAIAAAKRVANPGCYPTGAIALIRPLVDAGLLPPDMALTINAVSGYSGGGRKMIEDYEAGTCAVVRALRACARAQAHPRAVALFGAHAAADLRAVRRQLPPGHAGVDPAASRCAAGQALPARPGAGARCSTIAAATLISVVQEPGAAMTRLAAETLNGTDRMELFVFGKSRSAPGRAGGAARQPRQGRRRRRGAEHAADARARCAAPQRSGAEQRRASSREGGASRPRRRARRRPGARAPSASGTPATSVQMPSPICTKSAAASSPAEPTSALVRRARASESRHAKRQGGDEIGHHAMVELHRRHVLEEVDDTRARACRAPAARTGRPSAARCCR